MTKKRVYKINNKIVVEGDPNLVTDHEILLKPITVDGKSVYMLTDNKGNILSTDGKEDGGGQIVVPTTNYLYIAKNSNQYDRNYMVSIETASNYIDWVTGNSRSRYSSEGCISVGGESPMLEIQYSDYGVTIGDTVPSADELLDYCMNTNYVPEYYGPFLRLSPNGYSGDYTESTQWKISPFNTGGEIAYIVDRIKGRISSYKENFDKLREE